MEIMPAVYGTRNLAFSFFEWIGDLTLFVSRTFAAMFPPIEFKELARQMDEVGSKSLPLVALAGSALGVVLSMHLGDSLARFGARSLIPPVIVLSIIKETGPIITALVVSGRVAAGIGAEIGSMRVTEQIDAIEASAVNPYKYLIATRVWACIFVLPLLTIFADFCGIVMGWLTTSLMEPISWKLFLTDGFRNLTYEDLVPSTFKTVFFGLLIGLIGCFQGMRATGGTQGVGRSATSSVVLASLFVILSDVILVKLIQMFFF